MANLIDYTYFRSELTIGQIEQATVQKNILIFIAKYQKQFLYALLGKTTTDAFIAGLLVMPTPDAKWTALLNELVNSTDKISPISNYVYYFYVSDNVTQTVGVGQSKPNVINGEVYSMIDKQTKAWNDMVRLIHGATAFIKVNESDYPSTDRLYCDYYELTHYKNSLNV